MRQGSSSEDVEIKVMSNEGRAFGSGFGFITADPREIAFLSYVLPSGLAAKSSGRRLSRSGKSARHVLWEAGAGDRLGDPVA